MKSLFFALCLFVLSSCQTSEILKSAGAKVLFPDGVYTQLVQVMVVNPENPTGKTQEFEFQALMKKNGQNLSVFGYNSFGISMLTIKSSGAEQAELSSSIAEIQKHKDFFLKLFPEVRQIFYLSVADFKSQKQNLEKTISGSIELKFDSNSNIPREIILDGRGKYKVTIINQKFKAALADDFSSETSRH